ncbi:MAG: hypothetical protein MJD61_01435 [Proteobacteria bacterium]|nr:hypothetical protein [Pseudomonadota bacterium]
MAVFGRHWRWMVAIVALVVADGYALGGALSALEAQEGPLRSLTLAKASGAGVSWSTQAALLGVALGGTAAGVWLLALLVRAMQHQPFTWLAPVLAAFGALLISSMTPRLPLFGTPAPWFALFSAVFWVAGGALMRTRPLSWRLLGFGTCLLPTLTALIAYALKHRGLTQAWSRTDTAGRSLCLITAATGLGMACVALLTRRAAAGAPNLDWQQDAGPYAPQPGPQGAGNLHGGDGPPDTGAPPGAGQYGDYLAQPKALGHRDFWSDAPPGAQQASAGAGASATGSQAPQPQPGPQTVASYEQHAEQLEARGRPGPWSEPPPLNEEYADASPYVESLTSSLREEVDEAALSSMRRSLVPFHRRAVFWLAMLLAIAALGLGYYWRWIRPQSKGATVEHVAAESQPPESEGAAVADTDAVDPASASSPSVAAPPQPEATTSAAPAVSGSSESTAQETALPPPKPQPTGRREAARAAEPGKASSPASSASSKTRGSKASKTAPQVQRPARAARASSGSARPRKPQAEHTGPRRAQTQKTSSPRSRRQRSSPPEPKKPRPRRHKSPRGVAPDDDPLTGIAH